MKSRVLKFLLPGITMLIIISCSDRNRGDRKAIDIVEACIKKYGGENYRSMDISFDYRIFRVRLKQDGDAFSYERTFKDSLGNDIHDVLTNDDFRREINGKKVSLSGKDKEKYKEGLNAVAYFVLLPFKLSEPAVKLKYFEKAAIGQQEYHKIGVTFAQDGGGKDHEDEFCYWISVADSSMDYFSYSNGGPRFRKAIAQNTISGIIFQDYENYKILDSTLATKNYDQAFIAGQDSLFSIIRQTNYSSNK